MPLSVAAAMFQVRGQFDLKLDAKGRLGLPARLREKLGDHELVLTHYDGCIQVYTAQRWRKMERQFRKLSMFSERDRAFLLTFVAGAAEVSVDTAGRINIPASLRRMAGLEKNVVFSSWMGLAEIWNPERLIAKQAAAQDIVKQAGGLEDFQVFDDEDEEDDF